MNKNNKIVIVGAGIAGLAAAHELLASGFEVTILESRNRCGGRIWVDQSLGMPLPKGATWIHGIDDNPLMQWVEKLSTPYFTFDFQKTSLFDRNGQPIAREKIADFDDFLNDAIQKAQQFSWQQQQDMSLADALLSGINRSQFSSLEEDLFSRKLRFFENYIGAEYELLSARHWDEEEYASGAHIILIDSYQSIITELAQGCTIQFDTEVNLIQERANDIVIYTNQDKIYADAVIVTVPLGVLKSQRIKFDPDLSSSKKAAIQRLGMGLLNMILLKFPTCFWPAQTHAFFLPNATTFSVVVNLTSLFKQPILVGYNGGQTARLLENETDEQVILKVMQQWQTVFPNIMKPEQYLLTRWGQDPYSLGSYSYLPVGATGEDRDFLAAPESNRLFFAGEATQRHFPATTHGAYLSGLREAKRIQQQAAAI